MPQYFYLLSAVVAFGVLRLLVALWIARAGSTIDADKFIRVFQGLTPLGSASDLLAALKKRGDPRSEDRSENDA